MTTGKNWYLLTSMIGYFTTYYTLTQPAKLAESIMARSIGHHIFSPTVWHYILLLYCDPGRNLIKSSIEYCRFLKRTLNDDNFLKITIVAWWCRTQIFLCARPLVCRWHSLMTATHCKRHLHVYPSHIRIGTSDFAHEPFNTY